VPHQQCHTITVIWWPMAGHYWQQHCIGIQHSSGCLSATKVKHRDAKRTQKLTTLFCLFLYRPFNNIQQYCSSFTSRVRQYETLTAYILHKLNWKLLYSLKKLHLQLSKYCSTALSLKQCEKCTFSLAFSSRRWISSVLTSSEPFPSPFICKWQLTSINDNYNRYTGMPAY